MGAFREQTREATAAMAAVFRNRNLRRLQLAFAGSVVGDWAYAVAVSVFVYREAGAGAVGALGVVRYVLMATVTPFAATLADRFPRRLVMVSSDTVRAVLVVIAAFVIRADGPAAVVFALAVLTSLCATPFRPAQGALLPELANDPSELTAANVASSTIESVGFFVGPAIAGILLGTASISTVYFFNAATFVWSAALVAGVRTASDRRAVPVEKEAAVAIAAEIADAAEANEPEGSRWATFSAGFRAILRSSDLRLIMGLYVGQTIIAGASLVFEVAIALDLLGLDESGMGFLSAMLGIGGLVGGGLALVLAQRNALARHFGIGVILWSAPLLMISLQPSVLTAVVAMVCIGIGNSIVDINASTILQRVVPSEVMGRVFGAMDTLLIAGMAIGSLCMPLLIEFVGLRWGLVVLGTLVATAVTLSYAALRHIDLHTIAPPALVPMSALPLFAPLSLRVKERLARQAIEVHLEPGEVLFREGDPGDRFYVIGEGTVRVDRSDSVSVELGPGDHFGEIALLRDVPRNATITACTDVTLWALDRDVFVPAVTSSGDAVSEADVVISRRLATA